MIGSIKDEVLDLNELAFYLIDFLPKHYPGLLEKRYNLTNLENTPLGIIQQIAKSRGFLLKGGEFDIDRTCQMIITEFRKGLIGNITLD